MFYNSQAIAALETRVGWAQPVPPSNITLSVNNISSTSGRTFDSYHKLATVENVKNTLGTGVTDQSAFQSQLDRLRKQSVLKALNAIYDRNPLANLTRGVYGQNVNLSGVDYSPVIIDRANVFDDVIGYQMAYDIIQMMISTSRSNMTERAVNGTYETLQIELEGASQSNSNLSTKGVVFYLKDSIDQAIAILFPQRKFGIYNATPLW